MIGCHIEELASSDSLQRGTFKQDSNPVRMKILKMLPVWAQVGGEVLDQRLHFYLFSVIRKLPKKLFDDNMLLLLIQLVLKDKIGARDREPKFQDAREEVLIRGAQ